MVVVFCVGGVVVVESYWFCGLPLMQVFDRLPKVLLGVSVAVFAFVALVYRSFIIPLRCILTIGMTVAW